MWDGARSVCRHLCCVYPCYVHIVSTPSQAPSKPGEQVDVPRKVRRALSRGPPNHRAEFRNLSWSDKDLRCFTPPSELTGGRVVGAVFHVLPPPSPNFGVALRRPFSRRWQRPGWAQSDPESVTIPLHARTSQLSGGPLLSRAQSPSPRRLPFSTSRRVNIASPCTSVSEM